MIIFGDDLHEKLDKAVYIDKQGIEHSIQMHDSLEKISRDCTKAGFNPLNALFPWMVEYSIGKTNRTNTKNSDDVVRVIKKFLKESEDKDSVYYKVLEDKVATSDEIFNDVMSFMFGGHETTSRALTTALFQLKKNPLVFKKLKEEVEEKLKHAGSESEMKQPETIVEMLNGESIDECEYLSMFVKEVLRFSTPAARSLGYKAN